MKDVQRVPGTDTDSDYNLLVAEVCTGQKQSMKFQKEKPRWDLEELYAQ